MVGAISDRDPYVVGAISDRDLDVGAISDRDLEIAPTSRSLASDGALV
jgi:hypothetical protein